MRSANHSQGTATVLFGYEVTVAEKISTGLRKTVDLYGAEGESLELMAALSLDTDEEPEEESLEEAAAPEEDFELA